MKNVDPSVATAVATRPEGFRLVRAALLTVIAVALVALLIPLTIHPLLQWSLAPTAAVSEPWPAAPPPYVAPTVAAAAAARLLPNPTPLPAPVWQELSYLTSVEFTTSSVVQEERTTEVPWLGTVVSDRLLLKAVGEVQVGIDLSQVKDVRIEGKTIRFTAPYPVVTSVELLPQESEVYERINVWLLSQYPGLETAALERARQQMREDITDNESMMKLAQEFSRLQLTEFLQKAGFSTVEITFERTQEEDFG